MTESVAHPVKRPYCWQLMVKEWIQVHRKMKSKEHRKTRENMRNKAMARKVR